MGIVPSLGGGGDPAGSNAGWAIKLFKEAADGTVNAKPLGTFRVEDYDATIDATLEAGLSGGAVTIEIEGIADDNYRTLKAATVMHLMLYWRDVRKSPGAAVGAALGGIVGATDLIAKLTDSELDEHLVAELAITEISRVAGERRYVTRIAALSRAYHHLKRARVGAEIVPSRIVEAAISGLEAAAQAIVGAVAEALGGGADAPAPGAKPPPAGPPLLKDALTDIFKRARIDHEFVGLEPLDGADPEVTLDTTPRQPGVEVVREATKVLVPRLGKAGRPMVLFRDRKVIVGPRNPFKPEGDGDGGLPGIAGGGADPALPLTEASGLLGVQSQPPLVAPDGTERKSFLLTLKGSGRIKPGDLVKFRTPPAEDLSGLKVVDVLAGSVLGGVLPDLDGGVDPPTYLYVNTVRHRLGRTTGFVTRISGVVVADAGDVFDAPPPRRSDRCADGTRAEGGRGADRAADATRGVRRLIEAALDRRHLPEVAEVRVMTTVPGATPSKGVGQTSLVWPGLAAAKPTDPIQARRYRAARIENQPPTPINHVSYLTPFAWQEFGLILPRYPGTRVMLGHRGGEAAEPFDMGAVFTGQGPESAPGDWWLRLPIGVPEYLRGGVPPIEDAPVPHAGPASHDLIDADGDRVIEHRSITIRIGDPTEVTDRPKVGEAAGVTIEHAGGARLTMRQDGTVEIEARSLDLKSTQGGAARLSLSNGNIEIEAGTVDIKVADKVDIHG